MSLEFSSTSCRKTLQHCFHFLGFVLLKNSHGLKEQLDITRKKHYYSPGPRKIRTPKRAYLEPKISIPPSSPNPWDGIAKSLPRVLDVQ